MVPYRQSPDFLHNSKIRHAFFTRQGGVGSGIYDSLNGDFSKADALENIAENRWRAAAELGVAPENFLSCYQIHSPTVVTVTVPWLPAERPQADAMVTNIPNLALVILTADCVPILFADENAGVIGAAHAGWRGAIGGVIDNTLAAMEALGAKRSRIAAALGACIWQASYEVGPEFPAPFLAENPAHERFFRPAPRPAHYLFDLPGYVVTKLRGLGVASVTPSIADTLPDAETWFSYRRNTLQGHTKVGSLMSAIVIKD